MRSNFVSKRRGFLVVVVAAAAAAAEQEDASWRHSKTSAMEGCTKGNNILVDDDHDDFMVTGMALAQ